MCIFFTIITMIIIINIIIVFTNLCLPLYSQPSVLSFYDFPLSYWSKKEKNANENDKQTNKQTKQTNQQNEKPTTL